MYITNHPGIKIQTTILMSESSIKPLINLSDLTVAMGNRILFRSLSVGMYAGESWSILGPNGSGKTTLLETIAGLRSMPPGAISIAGDAVESFSPRQLALHRSMLFQKTADAFPATVMETVLSGRHPHIPYWQTESEIDRDFAKKALEMVDLTGFEDRDINTLSGGEYQRVSIATCLAQDTQIRLFDEPANHLDLKHQNSILELISTKHQHLNLLVLQDINQAWRYCSHALLINPDATIETGTIEEMLTVEKLEALYGCRLKTIQDGESRVFVHL